MMTFDIGAIRRQSDERLSGAPYNPQKLALIYAGAALGVSLIITLLDLMLLRSIGNTGGLSGLGMRSVLETIREVLRMGLNLALPFWEFGFIFTALAMARGGNNRPEGLLEGFRRFGAVLRLQLLQSFLYLGMCMLCVYIGSFLYSFTPAAVKLMTMMEPVMVENVTVEQIEAFISQIPPEQLLGVTWPALAFSAVAAVAVLIPLYYRLRMAPYFVMDEPKMGAIMAMLASSRYMRKNRVKWFRLDLSFWWYYVILIVSVLVCYGDSLLPLLGVELPISDDGAWLLFYVLGAVILFLLDWLTASRVQTAYALAYDTLRQQEPYTPPAKPVPQNLPWDEYPTEDPAQEE